MSDGVTVTIDQEALNRALDQVPDLILAATKAASAVTAANIVKEAQARVARGATGETASGIQALEDRSGVGWVVVSGNVRMPNLPLWLEKGTWKMTARPYFYASADLEVGPHNRRMQEAVQDAINQSGLGA